MKFIKFLSALAALVLSAGFIACEQLTEQAPVAAEEAEYAAIIIAEPQAEPGIIAREASADAELLVVPPPSDRNRTSLGVIFRQMELTREQMRQVQQFMRAQHDCMRSAMEALRNAEREIRDSAEARRREIMSALRAGEIDRQAAGEQLQQLNQRVRQALMNNPARERARQAQMRCHEAFNRSVRSILTEEQAGMWDRWIAGHKGNGGNPRDTTGGGHRDPRDTTGGGRLRP